MTDSSMPGDGLIHAFVLDGQGGARSISYEQLHSVPLGELESLWLHWDRSNPYTRQWLRENSGLSEFACDLMLEENTRPRLLPLPEHELLLFLRGVNLNPGAEPEDMVSVRIFADAQRVISLRLRPLRATEALIEALLAGSGPKTASELVLSLADYLTDKVEGLLVELSELTDEQEELVDAGLKRSPDHGLLLQMRRRAASLRRFLAPQRDIFAQLTRHQLPWFVSDDGDYWNELNNRLTRYLEELELTRERISLVLEAENRRTEQRMNHNLYRFGIIAGVFLPLTFLTGLLGINVGGIPLAEHAYGFWIVCALMVATALGQWWLLRRMRLA